jgi:hypothetical protein
MSPVWIAVTYLVGRARSRAQSAREGHPESGALSLEWIVIAVLLVAAATAAAVFFNNAITAESGKLP